MNPWKDINSDFEEISTPDKVVEEAFSGLSDFSSSKVGYELHRVNFFPEEVVYSNELFNETIESFSTWRPRAQPHPDFGYNPKESKDKQFFRYRLLLYPTSCLEPKFELFKFKYPIFFYPVTLYVEKGNFNLLDEYLPDKGFLEVESRNVLENYITKIIQSNSTIEIIKRLMVL